MEIAIPGWVQLCGNIAPFAALVVFLAPFPTMQQIQKERSVGSLPLLPYSSMMANCFLWMVYGIGKDEIRVWGTNGLGWILAMYYMRTFIRYASIVTPKSPTYPGSLSQHVQGNMGLIMGTLTMVSLTSSSSSSALILFSTEFTTQFIGNVAVLFCITMFASPLAALRTVLQTKSTKSIPLPFTLATVLNCLLWTIYGIWGMHDVNIYMPNLLGLGFGVAQVALKLYYGSRTLSGSKSDDKLNIIL